MRTHMFFGAFRAGSGTDRRRGLQYGRVLIGGQEAQVLPPISEHSTHTIEMMVTHMDRAGVDRVVLLQGPILWRVQSLCR